MSNTFKLFAQSIRDVNNETRLEMAKKLNVLPKYLSNMESKNSSVPVYMVERFIKNYPLNHEQYNELCHIVLDTVSNIQINVLDNLEYKELLVLLVTQFPKMNKEKKEQLKQLIYEHFFDDKK